MNLVHHLHLVAVSAAVVALSTGVATADPPKADPPKAAEAADPSRIVEKVLEADPWGLGGAEVNARAIVVEKDGRKRELAFVAKSRRYAGTLAKSIVRFTSPADVAGMRFLQVQNADGEDERHLYTPDLKRSRRIAGKLRADAFMGTDFTYADLDRRDLRKSKATLKADETLEKYDCFHLEVVPQEADAVYAKLELWVRKDNFVPLKWNMFSKSGGTLAKTLVAKELQRISGRWFITRSLMTDTTTGRSTELLLEKIDPREDLPLDQFTVRNLEKE